jgi:hypothetical protein
VSFPLLPRRAFLLVALTLLAAALLVAAPDSGATGGKRLDIGFADYLYGDAASSEHELDLTDGVNADVIRVNMYWSGVATSQPADPRDPADPAYDWTQYDRAIVGATQHGFDVDLTVFSAPPWAEGPNRPSLDQARAGVWRPDPDKYGDFAHAVALRYSGGYAPPGGVLPPLTAGDELPAVKYFEAWNEPNLSTYIQPQWDGKRNVSSDIYASLLNSFYAEVKAVDPNAQVVSGGTAPYGDPPGGPNRTQPLRFYQELLCLTPKDKRTSCPNGEKSKFDIIAHHPINREDSPRTHAINRGDIEIADFGELTKLLRKAERLGTTGTGGKHGLWANEVWWQTDPPDKAEGVSLKTHARWTAEALYLLWKQGASNVSFLQFRDAKYTPGEFTLASYQTGVYTYEGKRKPTADAVAFPFVTEKKGRKLIAWGIAPESGKLTIEVKGKGGFKRLDRLSAKAGKVFKTKLPAGDGGKQKLRARVSGETSPVWVQK